MIDWIEISDGRQPLDGDPVLVYWKQAPFVQVKKHAMGIAWIQEGAWFVPNAGPLMIPPPDYWAVINAPDGGVH